MAKENGKMTKKEREHTDLTFLKAAEIILSRRFGESSEHDRGDALLIDLLRNYISSLDKRLKEGNYGKEDAE